MITVTVVWESGQHTEVVETMGDAYRMRNNISEGGYGYKPFSRVLRYIPYHRIRMIEIRETDDTAK